MEQAIEEMPAHLARLMKQIPVGRVTTYGTLGLALGDRSATRWVASYLRHEASAKLPLQRVVRVDGTLTDDPTLSLDKKRRLLRAENVVVHQGRVWPLAEFLFTRFTGPLPLERLREIQRHFAAQVAMTPLESVPRQIGAVDTSYAHGVATAAYVLWDCITGELVWQTTLRRAEAFPYISGYLTFRELPLLLDLIDRVRQQGRLSDVVLVDGTGMLHPRRIGIASHFGAVTNHPTIGVAKKLLWGRVARDVVEPGEFVPVYATDTGSSDEEQVEPAKQTSAKKKKQGEQLGWAVRPVANRGGMLYVSPGHRTNLGAVQRVVTATLRGRSLPEPIYWADRLSREAARAGRTST